MNRFDLFPQSVLIDITLVFVHIFFLLKEVIGHAERIGNKSQSLLHFVLQFRGDFLADCLGKSKYIDDVILSQVQMKGISIDDLYILQTTQENSYLGYQVEERGEFYTDDVSSWIVFCEIEPDSTVTTSHFQKTLSFFQVHDFIDSRKIDLTCRTPRRQRESRKHRDTKQEESDVEEVTSRKHILMLIFPIQDKYKQYCRNYTP